VLRLAEAIVITIALLVACGGVGGSILRWAHVDEPGETHPAHPLSFGVSAAFGLALLVACGGLGVLARIPVVVTVFAFAAAGIALQSAHVARHRPRWTSLWVGVLAIEVVALGLVLLTQAGVGIAFRLNVCDDVLAYLPEARRLLATHTLLEPWSTRRLQNFGGQTFLQAIYIRFLGKDALGLGETLLPVGLLWLLLSTALRRPLTRLLSLVPLLFLPFFDVARANTAGTLSPVPLLVALGVLVLVLRHAAEQANRRGVFVAAAAVGITGAAVVAIRTNAAPAAALVCLVGAGTIAGTPRERVRATTISVVAGVAVFVPWAAAMWESSGTPLYPLLRGNENPRVPSVGRTSSIDVADFLHSVRHFFSSATYPAALVVLLLIVMVAHRIFPKTAPIAALMVGAGLANVVLVALSLSVAGISDFDRYTFPLAGGALFFLLRGAFVRLDEESAFARRAALAPVILTVVVVVAFFWIGTRHPDAIVKVRGLDAARAFVEDAADVHDPDAVVTSEASVADARAALAAIPRGARTILAVSEPDAFWTAGADLQSMDEPGSAAPGGAFPFFSGPEAKVRALRRNGYDYLVVSPGVNNLCYEHGRIAGFLRSTILSYRLLAPYVLDFFDDMDHLAQRYPRATRTISGFYVIDLHAVPGTAPRRAA
jgi:hypothetical protein